MGVLQVGDGENAQVRRMKERANEPKGQVSLDVGLSRRDAEVGERHWRGRLNSDNEVFEAISPYVSQPEASYVGHDVAGLRTEDKAGQGRANLVNPVQVQEEQRRAESGEVPQMALVVGIVMKHP